MKVHDFVFSDGTVRSVEVFDVPLAFLDQALCHDPESFPHLRGLYRTTDYGSYEYLDHYVLVVARLCEGVPFATVNDYVTLMNPRRDLETVGYELEGFMSGRLPINDYFEDEICKAYGVPNTYHDVYEVWHIVDPFTEDLEVYEVEQRFVNGCMVYDGPLTRFEDGILDPFGYSPGFGGISTGVDFIQKFSNGTYFPDTRFGMHLVMGAMCRFGKVHRVFLLGSFVSLADAYAFVSGERRENEYLYFGDCECFRCGDLIDEGSQKYVCAYEIWHVVGDLFAHAYKRLAVV